MGLLNPIFFLLPILLSISLPLTYSHADPIFTYFQQCLQTTIKPPPANLTSILIPKSSPQYNTVLTSTIRNHRFRSAETTKPVLIITPTTPAEVSAAVVCAKAAKPALHLRIRSGGHDYEGLSCSSTLPGDFVILDLLHFRKINVNAAAKTAVIEAAATLGELYFSIWNASKTLAFPAGLCQTVAAGGHISGAGYGHLVRRFGLTSDNVEDAQIVLADGRILDRKGMGDDLFWAIRGGGGASFGVILSYNIKLLDVPEIVTCFNIQKPGPGKITDLVAKWFEVMKVADKNLFMRLLLQPSYDKDVPPTAKVTFIALFLGNSDALLALMTKEFPELGVTKADCKEMSFAETLLFWSNQVGKPVQVLTERGSSADVKYEKRKSDYIMTPIPKEGLDKLWTKLGTLKDPGMVFNSYGGVMAETPEDMTPFPHRKALALVQYSGNWVDPAESDKIIGEMRDLYVFMEPYVSKNPRQAFWNYRDLDIGVSLKGDYDEAKVYGAKYFMANFERLVKVKSVVDPDDFFRHEQTIPVVKGK